MTLARTVKHAAARLSALRLRMHGPQDAGGGAGVLMYHRVGDPTATWSVHGDRFAAQISGLRALGYAIRPLMEIVDAVRAGRALPPRTTAITFDDGYGCVHGAAFPVLRLLNAPATVFLATKYIGTPEPFPFDGWGKRHHATTPPPLWRPLTWEQCREMQASGVVSLGSHTHSHENFARDIPGLRADLAASRDALTRELGAGPRLFAYPGGATSLGLASDAMAAEVAAAGFAAAFTTDYGRCMPGADAYHLPRYEVTAEDTPATIAAKLEGHHDWVGRLRELYRLRRRVTGARFGQDAA